MRARDDFDREAGDGNGVVGGGIDAQRRKRRHRDKRHRVRGEVNGTAGAAALFCAGAAAVAGNSERASAAGAERAGHARRPEHAAGGAAFGCVVRRVGGPASRFVRACALDRRVRRSSCSDLVFPGSALAPPGQGTWLPARPTGPRLSAWWRPFVSRRRLQSCRRCAPGSIGCGLRLRGRRVAVRDHRCRSRLSIGTASAGVQPAARLARLRPRQSAWRQEHSRGRGRRCDRHSDCNRNVCDVSIGRRGDLGIATGFRRLVRSLRVSVGGLRRRFASAVGNCRFDDGATSAPARFARRGLLRGAPRPSSAAGALASEGWPFLACRVSGVGAGFVGSDEFVRSASRARRVSVRGALRPAVLA